LISDSLPQSDIASDGITAVQGDSRAKETQEKRMAAGNAVGKNS